MQSLQVAGSAAELGVSIQASDDPYGSYGLASDAFDDGFGRMKGGPESTHKDLLFWLMLASSMLVKIKLLHLLFQETERGK
nr:hypothetical protein BaRGS_024984 [Batillaria attramentaria]